MPDYIYTLSDPRTNVVRYVGKATDTKKRLSSHLNGRTNDFTHKACWIRKLKREGVKPVMEVIDVIPTEEWEFWEMHYISLFKSWGFDLTNATAGGGGPTKQVISAETRAKMSAAHTGKHKGPFTLEHRQAISAARKGTTQSAETKQKKSQALLGRFKGVAQAEVTCPCCGKSGGASVMMRWHFEKCKHK